MVSMKTEMIMSRGMLSAVALPPYWLLVCFILISGTAVFGQTASNYKLNCTTTGQDSRCSNCIFLHPTCDSSSGIISSPSHPSFYPSNLNCTWDLTAPTGYFISVNLVADMDIEDPTNQDVCEYDYLGLSFFNASGGPLANTDHFCGNISASKLNNKLGSFNELQSQAVIVHFHSDNNYAGKGFQLRFNLQVSENNSDHLNTCSINNGGCEQVCSYDVCTNTTCSCRVGYKLAEDGYSCKDVNECELKYKEGGCQQRKRCTNSAGSFQCHCKPGYRLAEDGRKCLECGGEFNNSRGVIQSENYPIGYPAQQNCNWTVFAWPDYLLRISIKHMDIFRSTQCTEDFLKLEKGNFPYQGRLCGRYNNITYHVENSTHFRFRSRNGRNSSSGFQLEYLQVLKSELGSLEMDYLTVNGKYILYSKKRWIEPF